MIAVLALLSSRGKTSPSQSALRNLAAQTGGTYQRKAFRFAQIVRFDSAGYRFTYEVTQVTVPTHDSSYFNQHLGAVVVYHPVEPFELTLDPKAVKEIVVRLKRSDAVKTVLGIPSIDDVYRVRTSNPQMATALLNDAALQRQLAAVAASTSRLEIGSHGDGTWVAFGEEAEVITSERLLAIRDLLAALVTALERRGLAVPVS